jgi:hypothetical protein
MSATNPDLTMPDPNTPDPNTPDPVVTHAARNVNEGDLR